MSIGIKYLKSGILIIAGILLVTIVAGRQAHGGGQVAGANPLVLYASPATEAGVYAGRFYLAFPLEAPGVDLAWTTPTIAPLSGLTGLDVYVVPPGTPAAEPDTALAKRQLDTIPAEAPTLIVITGACTAPPPPEQTVRVTIQARFGATIADVPIVHDPTIGGADLAVACLTAFGGQPPAKA